MNFKKNRITKSIFILFLTFSSCFLFSYFSKFNDNIEINSLKDEGKVENVTKNSSYNFKVHFLDVGQADSILIEQNGHYMLIDAGDSKSKDIIIPYVNNLGIKKFDYIVGTHSHEDHIGSLDDVILNFGVENVLFPRQTSTTKTFENFVNSLKIKNLKLIVPKSGDTYSFGDATFKILAPNSSTYEDINNYSIVIKMVYKNTSYIFTGDAEKLSEEEIISKYKDEINCDVLKIGHHGSSTSTSENFLKFCSPKYAIISLGRNNEYNHPHRQVINRLKKFGVDVYRTDEFGTVILESDGTNIIFNNKKSAL